MTLDREVAPRGYLTAHRPLGSLASQMEASIETTDEIKVEVFYGAMVAIMLFVVIAMIMTGLGEYREGTFKYIGVAALPDCLSTEGARIAPHSDNGFPHYEETLWK